MLMSTFSFFFNDTATTEIYTLSLHDALPIFRRLGSRSDDPAFIPHKTGASAPAHALRHTLNGKGRCTAGKTATRRRSEEHTSELQSQFHLVCRLLLEKKKKYKTSTADERCRR